ncbi:MAG: type II and III secretion system protein [Rubricoccaceae bacterium]
MPDTPSRIPPPDFVAQTPRTMTTTFLHRSAPVAALALFLFAGAAATAQTISDTPDRDRVVRGYVPPDELVSFPATTSMDQFLQLINPTFFRVTGKRVVDPRDRSSDIGVALNGVHFIDAFELVLDRYGLDFSETESYFIITDPIPVAATTDGEIIDVIGAGGVGDVDLDGDIDLSDLPATADTREIRIDAIIFELDQNRAHEIGTNWSALFGEAASESGGGGTQFFLNAGSFFEALDGFLEASSDQIDLNTVLNLFRYFESEGLGQTIASPFTTVQSGEQATIQSGQDFPINIRDFQGNTITQYVSTGVIVNVTPTLISDEREGTVVDFIHLNVDAQKSSGTPTDAGVVVNKNSTKTQLPLLSGEMRAIGGLISTDERVTRRGVPILKDIPVLNYLFSYKQRTQVKKELVVVLQARTVDSLRDRNGRALPDDIIRRERSDYRDRMDTINPGAGDRTDLPPAMRPIDARNDRAPRN